MRIISIRREKRKASNSAAHLGLGMVIIHAYRENYKIQVQSPTPIHSNPGFSQHRSLSLLFGAAATLAAAQPTVSEPLCQVLLRSYLNTYRSFTKFAKLEQIKYQVGSSD